MRERILALVPGGIGDQILFFPTLDGLRQAYPNADIEVMTEPRSAGAYEVCPSITKVLTFAAFKEQITLGDISDLLGRIRERQYDAVVSLGRSFGIRVLLWLTGIPKRVGYIQSGTGEPWLTDGVLLKQEQYAAHMYMDLLQGFDIEIPAATPQVRVMKPALDWCEQERQRLFTNPQTSYVLLHPGASQLSIDKGIRKIYPVEQWIKVIQGFRAQRPELPIVLLIGPEDGSLADAFTEQLRDLLISRPLQLGQVTGLIAGASLLLCTDSAPMHLGVANQTPLVALFGPTDPKRLLPSEGPFRPVTSAGGDIEGITPDQILQTIFQS